MRSPSTEHVPQEEGKSTSGKSLFLVGGVEKMGPKRRIRSNILRRTVELGIVCRRWGGKLQTGANEDWSRSMASRLGGPW